MHRLLPNTATRAILFAAAVACATHVAALDADTVEREFITKSRAANAAREAGKLQDVERLRTERWDFITDAATDKAAISPLLEAFRALQAVDGSTDDGGQVNPGLVNELRYDEAARVLADAWKAMCAAAPQGPVLGEVATRLFEVVHQKAAFWAGTGADKDAAKPPIDDQSLLKILEEAERLDPCCIAVIPMIEWLKPLDPKESFLRAEVRPSFKARQQRLLSVSHPLLKAHNGGGAGQGQAPPNDPQAQGAATEGIEAPVLPWHAPTEYLKAASLQVLLDETERLEDVLQNWYSLYVDANGNPIGIRYIIPRKPLKGSDANGNRFELLYGRLFLTSVLDKKNRRRPAALLLDAKGRWEQRMVDLLWREPTEQELDRKPKLRELRDLVMRLEVVEKWSLAGSDFRLCGYPIQDTRLLLQSDAQILCLKDSLSLPKLKFKHANNDPDALDALLDDRPGEFYTDPQILQKLTDFRVNPDKTRHPLVELAKETNCFVVLSRAARAKTGPVLFKQNGQPFLQLQDGGKLLFNLEDEGAPVCYRETTDGRLVYPLTGRGIPGAIVEGCGAGRCMTQVLNEAGFSDADAQRAIREWIASDTIPDAFVKYVRAKAEALHARDGNSEANRKPYKVTPQDVYHACARLVDDARTSQLGLKPPGINKHITIRRELTENFFLFGYRHFYDNRGNIFFSARLARSCPVLQPNGGYTIDSSHENHRKKKLGQNPGNGPVDPIDKLEEEIAPEDQHVFAMVQPDGKRIPIDQVYRFTDFLRIKRNKRDEYLTESLVYAPSFGTYAAMIEDALHPFVHPDDKNPLEPTADKKLTPPASPSAFQFHDLQSPVSPWLAEEENQFETLKNLHNAYVELIQNATSKLDTAVVNESQMAMDPAMARFGANRRRFSILNQGEYAKALLAIQIASARRYAKKKFFHRAIVYYNDLLERMPPGDLSDPYTPLLEKVPTTEVGRDCVNKLENRINELGQLICLQMELAGTLQSAGINESAHAIFSRVADDVEYFIKPTFDIMKHLLASYGLQMEQSSDRAISRLQEFGDLASRALTQFGLQCEWRVIKNEKPGNIADKERRAVRLVELIEKSNGREKLTKAESQEFEELQRLDSEDRPAEFQWWLERKKLILGDGSNPDRLDLACRVHPQIDYDVRNGCPLSFAVQQGFQEPRDVLVQLIRQSKVDDVVKWCADPLVAANAEPIDLDHAFLLAWYWADLGDNPKARAALMHVAQLCRECAAAAGKGTPEYLAHNLNMFRTLACASCLGQNLPGVRGTRVDFTDSLRLQLLMWEREWLATALPPHQAAAQADDVRAMIDDAMALSSEKRQGDFSLRYFFPDYVCEFAGVPDYVAEEAQMPDKHAFFKEIKPGEVEGNAKPAAVREDKQWVQVTEQESLEYFKRLPTRVRIGEIDRAILGVR